MGEKNMKCLKTLKPIDEKASSTRNHCTNREGSMDSINGAERSHTLNTFCFFLNPDVGPFQQINNINEDALPQNNWPLVKLVSCIYSKRTEGI